MENLEEFMTCLKTRIYELQAFGLCCKYKDICLKNYTYKPRKNDCNQIIHEWEHKFKDKIITVDIIRQILVNDIFEMFSDLQSECLQESQKFEPNEYEHEVLQRKIKKIAEICIIIEKGELFKEFINCYRYGYLN